MSSGSPGKLIGFGLITMGILLIAFGIVTMLLGETTLASMSWWSPILYLEAIIVGFIFLIIGYYVQKKKLLQVEF